MVELKHSDLQDLAQTDGASRAIRQLASLEFRRSGQANMCVLQITTFRLY